jgi:hypothetical protein
MDQRRAARVTLRDVSRRVRPPSSHLKLSLQSALSLPIGIAFIRLGDSGRARFDFANGGIARVMSRKETAFFDLRT